MRTDRPNIYWILLAVLILSVLAALPACAQQVKLPRAAQPMMLFGFEGTDGVKGWHGLQCSLTSNHVSEGSQAMSFSIPQEKSPDEDLPRLCIDWNSGQGYAVNDFSHYGKIAFDAWIDSTEEEDLCVEFREKSGKGCWGQDFVLTPGKKNEIEIPVTDLWSSDSSNVQQIAMYSMHRPRAFAVTVDNFRLLPGEKAPIVDVELLYPNYRNMIFPKIQNAMFELKYQKEEYNVRLSDLFVTVQAVGGDVKIAKRINLHSEHTMLTFPVGKLPAGSVKLTATVQNKKTGETMVARSWTLRKITQKEASSFQVYLDENDNMIFNGKPFFPLGWYGKINPEHVKEIADSPFNCLLDYGTNNVSKDEMLKYLDKIQQSGLKQIYCMNDLYPTATYFKDKSWNGVTGNDKIAEAVVDAYKSHPAILAWYLNDELSKTLAPSLEDYYQRVAQTDPSHPCVIVQYNMPELAAFPNTTDIMGVDPYPVPKQPITNIAGNADTAESVVRGHKPVWVVLQAFAWYQYNSSNKDRSHIPSAAELIDGHAPTYEESRCMTYQALTHGAKGLIYYSYYDMRVLPQYKEMWRWMKKIGSEVKTLSPVLLSPDDYGTVQYVPSNATIHTKLKVYDGRLYLMAVNTQYAPFTVRFAPGRKIARSANVMFERRSIITDGRQLVDTFKPLEAHVYDLGRVAE